MPRIVTHVRRKSASFDFILEELVTFVTIQSVTEFMIFNLVNTVEISPSTASKVVNY
jgi:hypothetical protein